MVHPDHIEPIAKAAYGRFRERYPKEPEWKQLPNATQTRWRDDVVAAGRVRNKTSEVFSEQCVFEAITEWEAEVQKPGADPVTTSESPSSTESELGLSDTIIGLFRGKSEEVKKDADN